MASDQVGRVPCWTLRAGLCLGRAEPLPWGPCCAPQVWSEQFQQQLQTLEWSVCLLIASSLVPKCFLEMAGLGE